MYHHGPHVDVHVALVGFVQVDGPQPDEGRLELLADAVGRRQDIAVVYQGSAAPVLRRSEAVVRYGRHVGIYAQSHTDTVQDPFSQRQSVATNFPAGYGLG